MTTPIMITHGLTKTFKGRHSFLGETKPAIQAVADINLSLLPGETLGIVGESGCGKSTLARMMIGLDKPSGGEIQFKNQSMLELRREQKHWLHRKIQFVFQDPLSSLNPRKTIRQILEAPLKYLLGKNKADRTVRVEELMQLTNLPTEFLDRYPHELSGGQCQRIGIARALAAEPELIVFDEPVSALDVSVQAQILNLLRQLKRKFDLTYVFISHDLAVVESLCDKIAVMYLGRIVEYAPRDQLFEHPRHPYTRVLLSSVPIAGQKPMGRVPLTGELPNPAKPPRGCAFEPRCYKAGEQCKTDRPPLKFIDQGRQVACFHPDDSDL